MATYKVIQDIEAEDHIIGPLTLRQFIYALVAAFCLYISFLCIVRGVAFLLVVFLPPGLLAGFFAFPFGQDQPTEIWALAKIRFFFKPRKRIWNQSGVKELVTITVPKKIERQLTDGLSQGEVKSRLRALADTIDSRGWAVKNVNVNLYAQPNLLATQTDSDRLVGIDNMPQQVPDYGVQASDDILDERSNPIAQQFDQMINASTQAHRQQLIQQMSSPTPAVATPAANNWFTQPTATSRQPAMPAPVSTTALGASQDEAALSAELKARSNDQPTSNSHLRTLQPMGGNNSPSSVIPNLSAPVDDQTQPTDHGQQITDNVVPASPAAPDPAILTLASNNDLNVATLAREAQKAKDDESSEGEVVISLH